MTDDNSNGSQPAGGRAMNVTEVLAADVMTQPVITIDPSASLQEAVRLMLEHRISGLPVVDADGAAVGMLTEGDLLRRAETDTEPAVSWWRSLLSSPGRLAERYTRTHGRTVGEIMTVDVIAVDAATPLAEVVSLMQSRHIRRLPVLQAGQITGIVSRADIMRELGRLLAAAQAGPKSDAQIRQCVLAQFAQERWVPSACIDVQVHDGTVVLRGLITSPSQHAALRVLAENIPGVKGVVDQLVWVEPYTGTTLQPPQELPP
jgi:CBS domain-containing protein